MSAAELAARLRHRVARDAAARDVRDLGREHGVDVWLVGGYVRDAALGRRSGDLDFSAGPGTLQLARALQERWRTAGFRFRRRGVTTWRFVTAGRQVDIVDTGRKGLQHDLSRRDLTINAVAFDPCRSRVIDPLGGLSDLRQGRLRLPRRGVIREDPLRALRLCRFLAQLPDFRLDARARREACSSADGLRRVAVERVREELGKLLGAPAPERGLEALERMGLLRACLPELLPLSTCQAGQGRPDVWTHTLATLAASARSARLPAGWVVRDREALGLLRWALLLHDVSKPETLAFAKDGRPTFHGHETLGARRAELLLERLRLPRPERRRVCRLIEQHLRPSQLAEAGAPARGLRRLVREAGADLPILLQHAACDARGSGGAEPRGRWRRLSRTLRGLLELWEQRQAAPPPRLIDGRDLLALGLAPGPRIGELLRRVQEQQDEGTVRTRQEALRLVMETDLISGE